ncbi:hypothetical protein CEK28_06235 [Xenophilus sp. AP218F]|nr:hypothetical protein CEK28_06235 [Xenophilus sp. AP218F]
MATAFALLAAGAVQASDAAGPSAAQAEQAMKAKMQQEIAARETSNQVMASMIAVRLKSLKVESVTDCQPEEGALACEVSYAFDGAGGKPHQQSRAVRFERQGEGWRLAAE